MDTPEALVNAINQLGALGLALAMLVMVLRMYNTTNSQYIADLREIAGLKASLRRNGTTNGSYLTPPPNDAQSK